jgi:DNA-binding IclR family transcriptional regulator
MRRRESDSHCAETTAGARSIGRAALVLRTLSTFGLRGADLKHVVAASGLPKATVHRILAALLEARMIERLEGGRAYRLGPEMFAFGATIAEVADLRGIAHPSLERLAAQSKCAVYLGIRSGFDGLCLDRVDGEEAPANLPLDVMDRWPLGVGVFSLALIAFLPDPEVRNIVEYNRRRLDEAERFYGERMLAIVAEIRKCGFAFQSMRTNRKLAGLAVPVLDRRRRPIASLTIVGLPHNMRPEYLQPTLEPLRQEAAGIAQLYQARRHPRDLRETWREWLEAAVGQK